MNVTAPPLTDATLALLYAVIFALLLAITGLLIQLLPWQRPLVVSALPRWHAGLTFAAIAAWLASQVVAAGAKALAPMLCSRLASAWPATAAAWGLIETSLGELAGLGVTGIAGIVCVAIFLALPAIFGAPSPIAYGIGTAPAWRGTVQGLLALIAILPGLIGSVYASVLLIDYWEIDAPQQETVVSFDKSLRAGVVEVALVLGFAAVVVAPLTEEILFRGIIYRALAMHAGALPAASLSGLLFALVHFNVRSFLPLAVLGMALALVFQRTGSLWPVIVLHGSFNLVQLAASYWAAA
ncbi:MAG: CPBP family intramembrane metalloprotease [Planctomycetes bacterium]|nr:CPBP family intramembrane metalloprotease [Planctomycetota bacterium]